MKVKKWLLTTCVLVLLGMVFAGCSVAEEDPAAAVGGSEAGAVIDLTLPSGRFVKPDDANYGIFLNPDGTYYVFSGDNTLVKGSYSLEGDQYIEESNSSGCIAPMVFKYTYDGKNLTFKYAGNPDDDTCLERKADFNNQTFVLSK